MKIDLQNDGKKIRTFVEKRVRDYPVYENLGPGIDTDPIALITLGYYFEQEGYFALVFDTRADADNDGEWTLHIENDVNILPFPKWCIAFERLYEGDSVDFILSNGKSKTFKDPDEVESVAALFGEMILETMLSLRESGAFVTLPLASKAFFVIEEFGGSWGWPEYKKRKTLGRLRKK